MYRHPLADLVQTMRTALSTLKVNSNSLGLSLSANAQFDRTEEGRYSQAAR